ncbi:NAD-dependent epimerase/dehydratase family protein [Rhodoferax sp. 4810]|uniref:NAD-dependent epimerase/dehydratase family protein n=1 Tax=Thiospirillum jenense TaxID=1653858 RepID=A0A839HBX3_9GAMM|nr:NAD-dependent epimerase/dehydratase family protein [Thiospirillum jenense]MBB1074332.1 NAD-dependent epimerase/dehydratase family protein [Rhodoferax jenense]MBB1126463.1 NAD-dependent epimerase/dehydratase family protein [Thiospirillum jenense]
MSHIFITGAAGFVGQRLCQLLDSRGFQVTAAVRHAGTAPPSAAAECVLGDLTRQPPLIPALRSVDAVVHLAGRAHQVSRPSSDEQARFTAANCTVTRHLAQQAAAAGVKRFIFVSTIKVLGEQTNARPPFNDDDHADPVGAYACSKWAAELALRQVATATGMERVILRPPLLYGAGAKANLRRLANWIQRGYPLPFAAVDNRRNLLSVNNFCDLIATCLTHPAAAGECFVVADHPPLSTPDLIRALAAALNCPARLWAVPIPLLRGLGYLSGQTAQIRRLCESLEVDGSRVQRQLDWQPPMTFDAELTALAADVINTAVLSKQ